MDAFLGDPAAVFLVFFPLLALAGGWVVSHPDNEPAGVFTMAVCGVFLLSFSMIVYSCMSF